MVCLHNKVGNIVLVEEQEFDALGEDSKLDNENYWQSDRNRSDVKYEYNEGDDYRGHQRYEDAFWTELNQIMSENRVRIPESVMEELRHKWVTTPQANT